MRTIIELISATATTTGLTVQASYDPNWYPTGVKISDAEFEAIPLRRNDWHGEWNYEIAARSSISRPISRRALSRDAGQGLISALGREV